MPITINGSGTVTGISAGGLPDGVITTDDIAANAVTQAKRAEQLTLDTAKASTSGTSVDFTGIPSWVKRITVMFNGVSISGTALMQIRLGTSSGVVSSGYVGHGASCGNAGSWSIVDATAGFQVGAATGATLAYHGQAIISNVTGNTWVHSGIYAAAPPNNISSFSSGSIPLSGTLDRIRITTTNGTDSFDAGSINILYE